MLYMRIYYVRSKIWWLGPCLYCFVKEKNVQTISIHKQKLKSECTTLIFCAELVAGFVCWRGYGLYLSVLTLIFFEPKRLCVFNTLQSNVRQVGDIVKALALIFSFIMLSMSYKYTKVKIFACKCKSDSDSHVGLKCIFFCIGTYNAYFFKEE